MSGYVWDLSGTDNQCHSYNPGHLIHWIHFNHYMREPSAVIPVSVEIDDDGLVHLEGDEVSLVRWNHRPALLRDALRGFGGRAVWTTRWHILAVPEQSFFGSARSVFSLAKPEDRRSCYVPRPAHEEFPGADADCSHIPPLRVAARYAAGKRRAEDRPTG